MKTTHFILFILAGGFLSHTASAQQIILLKFTAQQMNQHLAMDSLRIQNLTQGGDTVLHWPDTTLTILTVGTGQDYELQERFRLQQSYPNPVTDRASIKLGLPGQGKVELTVSDLLGRRLAMLQMDLQAGLHHFVFVPGSEKVYLITARWKQQSNSIKIINMNGQLTGSEQMRYEGYEKIPSTAKSSSNISAFTILPGDMMRCIGYKDSLMAVLTDSVVNNSTSIFSFGSNPPCSGQPFIAYGGQQYLTVKIGTQCWMAENLNIGTYVASVSTGTNHSDVSNNGIIEKYCYNNDTNQCNIFGGLYDWKEMMGYVTTPGVQGICPAGWHIPTDAELCSLTTFLDASVDCSTWGWSGTNAGGKLKEAGYTHWASPNTGATNSSGFTALPAGSRNPNGHFVDLTYYAYFWSSSVSSTTNGILRYLYYNSANVSRNYGSKTLGFSLRCLRDL